MSWSDINKKKIVASIRRNQIGRRKSCQVKLLIHVMSSYQMNFHLKATSAVFRVPKHPFQRLSRRDIKINMTCVRTSNTSDWFNVGNKSNPKRYLLKFHTCSQHERKWYSIKSQWNDQYLIGRCYLYRCTISINMLIIRIIRITTLLFHISK